MLCPKTNPQQKPCNPITPIKHPIHGPNYVENMREDKVGHNHTDLIEFGKNTIYNTNACMQQQLYATVFV